MVGRRPRSPPKHARCLPSTDALQWAVVFAQLLIGGTNHGIHGFLVPIRSKQVGPRWQQLMRCRLCCWVAPQPCLDSLPAPPAAANNICPN